VIQLTTHRFNNCIKIFKDHTCGNEDDDEYIHLLANSVEKQPNAKQVSTNVISCVIYRTIKNFDSKKVWRKGCCKGLTKKLWRMLTCIAICQPSINNKMDQFQTSMNVIK